MIWQFATDSSLKYCSGENHGSPDRRSREGCAGVPPLPEQVSAAPRRAPADEVLLADGCYFVCFGVDGPPNLHGTLRIETRTGRLFASGDFYRHDSVSQPVGLVPPPGSGIPIFPIAQVPGTTCG